MTIRSYSSSSASTYGRKRPALPSADVLRPMAVSVDYGARMTSRSASVPPSSTSASYARQQTPGPQYRLMPSRRPSSTGSASDLRSAATALSSRSPMQPGLSSRHSVSMSTLPTMSRGSRSNVRLSFDDDEPPRAAGSFYSTKSSFQRASHPLRASSYHAGKVRPRYGYLDDIEEEDKASQVSDLRMRASKAKEYLDQHRQVLDRLRSLQMNGPTPVVSVSPITSPPPALTTTSSIRRENTREYLPMRTPSVAAIRSEMTVSPARRALREMLGRGGAASRRQSYA